ncbi:MAG: NADPH-dependent assimilatory sulfite reductase hemoprotein subunit [Verrucomicrobiales bacterium]|jgi:sulfite reductase beta subunit-like hemoprotein|nr:NADPH-dependent assimilatory sulfite reductase hemoprotein subunit [Verrucomicrobiales bacterium]
MATKNVEEIKDQSRSLRGTLASTLQAPNATHFGDEDAQLIKFHGSYQEDDRDLRNKLKAEGKDKAWQFMVRSKIPGGFLTSAQYLAHDNMAGRLSTETLRFTTRQGIQLYGILLGSLKQVIKEINACGLTTIGACGDVVRNTMSVAVPISNPVYDEVQRLAEEISRTFYPKTTAYSEIWLDGEKLPDGKEDVEEPIYGRHYLPRKFKIAIAIPPRNDADILSNDIGLVPHFPNGKVEGYTLFVGGGFGMSHGQTATRPHLAQPLLYVAKEHVIDACIAVITTQRDHGNRADRKLARLKYLVANKGIEWFRNEVKSRLANIGTEAPKEVKFTTVSDLLGWHEQGNGKWFRGVWVPEGRIKDTDEVQYRTAFRKIAEKYRPHLHITANTNVYFSNIDANDKAGIDQILDEHKIPAISGLTQARQTAHACVSLPTCNLGLAESERAFGKVMNGIDAVLRELGLENEEILIRMTGCPNGCARPYNADFAFVGRAPGKYALYVGGSHRGDRLAGLKEKVVLEADIPAKVKEILSDFTANRQTGESFTDYWGRTQEQGEVPNAEHFHVEFAERAARLAAAGN